MSRHPTNGILLVNLGSPQAPDATSVRKYLAEFLWDPRIVDLPRPLWWVILHLFVLRVRPRRSARLYRKIWQNGESPLLAIARKQVAALQEELARRFAQPIPVELGMRYGQPSIHEGLQRLVEKGCRRVIVMPLFPQYSSATTASVFDAVADVFRQWKNLPGLRFIRGYYNHPDYIKALADSVRQHWHRHGKGEKLLMSFHGIPQRFVDQGDPYPDECLATARLVAKELGLAQEDWLLSFQSRFGKDVWLEPATDSLLEDLAHSGIRHLDILCPGFAADCLETLEEIAIQNRAIFLGAGGEAYHYIPALNDRPEHITALANIVEAELQGIAP